MKADREARKSAFMSVKKSARIGGYSSYSLKISLLEFTTMMARYLL
jgi:hypothetical protein